MENSKVFAMKFAKVYPLLVAKAQRKGRTRQEVDEVTVWLTGYTPAELERLLKRSIAGQMVADVPVGAFLSAGIDSSTVVALMQSLNAGRVRSFTIGMEEKDYNEAAAAKEIAAHLGTEHTELYITEKDAKALKNRDLPGHDSGSRRNSLAALSMLATSCSWLGTMILVALPSAIWP